MNRSLLLTVLTAAGLALAGPLPGARAGLLPTNVTTTPDGADFRWSYAIVLPTDTQLRPGDYFTIYDFGGYVPGTASQPADWTLSVANVGPTPNGVTPHDYPTVPNLTWTYTGPVLATGQTGLGNFWADSSFQGSIDSSFTAQTHRTSDGKVDANITATTVPVPFGTPEPATLALAGLGLPLLGLARLARRKAA